MNDWTRFFTTVEGRPVVVSCAEESPGNVLAAHGFEVALPTR